VDRSQDIACLGIPSENGTRAEGERLRAFTHRGAARQQYQPRVGVLASELADLCQVGQHIAVEDRHMWMVGTQNHLDAIVRHVVGDDLQIGIPVDHRPQAAGEEVLEVRDDEGDLGGSLHRGCPRTACTSSIGNAAAKGEPGPTHSPAPARAHIRRCARSKLTLGSERVSSGDGDSRGRFCMLTNAFGARTNCPRGALALLCVVIALVLAAPASAHRWSGESLPTGIGSLNGISCVARQGGGHCVAVGQNTTGGAPVVVVSDDGGKSWTPQALPHGVAGLFGVSCSSASHCAAVGEADTSGDHAAILGTSDGGQSWTLEPVPSLPGGSATAALEKVSCVGKRCLTTGIRVGFVLLSTDGGKSWSARGLPQGCKRLCLAYTADSVALTSSRVGYAGGGSQCGGVHRIQCPGILWKTTNGGGSWRIVFKGSPFVDAISCVDRSHCWAAAATFKTGEVFGSASGGRHWRRQNLPRFGGFFNDISCVRGAHDRCFAVGENGKRDRPVIAATADGGSHWRLDRSPPGSGPLYGVSVLGVGARAVGQDTTTSSGRALSF
jgi:photosystem II stability/assembly factor-like uncharacterized protein